MKTLNKIAILVSSLAVVTACGGGGGGGGGSDAIVQQPDITAPASFGLLKPVESATELTENLHLGLQRSGYVATSFEAVPAQVDAPVADGGNGELSGGAGDDFSGTNLQEAGVDEADIVKYDGEILYIVDTSFPDFFGAAPQPTEELGLSFAPPQDTRIRLLRTDTQTPATEQVSEIIIPADDFSIDGLYLSETGANKQLISVGHSNDFVDWLFFANDFYWRDGLTRVQAWDVDDPEKPSDAWSISLDGSLLASRRINNSLYLITRYSPRIEGLVSYPQSEEQIDANKALIAETPLSDLLPKVSHNDGAPQDLLAPTDCYVPNPSYEDSDVLPSGGSLITVTVVNLEAPDQTQSICLNAWSSGFYASTKAIYITANGDQNSTVIHKIALEDGGPVYRGSGEIPGYIGTSNPAFLMSEVDGDLRVVSSKWDDRAFPLPVVDAALEAEEAEQTPVDDGFGRHRLSVLRESNDGSSLENIAQLPNAERPAKIGKPGENVYAARFLGDRAYIVTFEVIDPLYVLDLSNPEDPMITGELEIPGFSTLLQPIGENLLLGIGQHVPLADQPLTQGVKVALFDVGDVSAPVSLGEVIIGKRGSSSPALYDHHALTVLNIDGAYRAALPIERHEHYSGSDDPNNDPWRWYEWSDSGLYMFDIDSASGSLSLTGTLINAQRTDEQPYNNSGLYNARSVIHGDAVFFLHNGEVSTQTWGK